MIARPYSAPDDFRGNLATDSLFDFQRDSMGSTQGYSRAGGYQYGQTRQLWEARVETGHLRAGSDPSRGRDISSDRKGSAGTQASRNPFLMPRPSRPPRPPTASDTSDQSKHNGNAPVSRIIHANPRPDPVGGGRSGLGNGGGFKGNRVEPAGRAARRRIQTSMSTSRRRDAMSLASRSRGPTARRGLMSPRKARTSRRVPLRSRRRTTTCGFG